MLWCSVCVVFLFLGCSGSSVPEAKKFLDQLARNMGANDWLETLDVNPLSDASIDEPPDDLDEELMNALMTVSEDPAPHPVEEYRIRIRDLKYGNGGIDVRSASVCPPRDMELIEFGGIHEINSQRFAKGSMTNIFKGYGYSTDGATVRARSVVKVVSSKADSEVIEAVYRDTSALEILAKTGIAPKPLHVKPSTMDRSCLARIMVSSFVGERTLKHVRKNDQFRKNLSVMASIAVRGLEMLKTLHSKGIVHGDIHTENFVFYNDSPIARTLKMIDFGRSISFLVQNDTGEWVHIPEPPIVLVPSSAKYIWTPSLLSVYELQSLLPVDGQRRAHTLTRRDDIARFAEMFVVIMLEGYEEQLVQVESNVEACLRIKTAHEGLEFIDSTFSDFFLYSSDMKFDETPLYDVWISRFRKLVGQGADTPYLD